MAYDGSGTFNRVHNWVADKAASIDITASEMDAEDNGFAAGLTLAVTRDGQGKMGTDFVPAADASYDLGTGGTRWRNLALSGNATVTGNATVSGILSAIGVSLCKVKSALTARTSTTTLSNDPDLVIAVPGAGSYAIEGRLFPYGPSGGGGFQWNINYSGTYNSFASSLYNDGQAKTGSAIVASSVFLGSSIVGANFSTIVANLATSQTDGMNRVSGILIATGAGNLGVSWAQNTSNTNATNLGAGSYLLVTKLA